MVHCFASSLQSGAAFATEGDDQARILAPPTIFFKFFLALKRETCVHSQLPAAFFGVAGNFHLRAAQERNLGVASPGAGRTRRRHPADEVRRKERWALTIIIPTQRRQFFFATR